MIFESRSIVFTHDELLIAIRPLLETKGFTGEEVLEDLDIDLDNEGELAVILDFENMDEKVTLNSREVGAAVLNHSIEQGIPLPRGSYKELTMRGDMVAMVVRLESGIGHGAEIESEDAVTV